MSVPRVVIIGGGFGGLYSALSLSSANSQNGLCEVVLVDPNEAFTFLPLLYELLCCYCSSEEVQPTYEYLLRGRKIRFIQDSVDRIDVDAKRLHLHTSRHNPSALLSFDFLVIAVGAQARSVRNIPGHQYAVPFYGAEDAAVIRTRLKASSEAARRTTHVVVLGGGPGGCEIASVLAGYQKGLHVTLVESDSHLMKRNAPSNRLSVLRSFARRQVDFHLHASVRSITRSEIRVYHHETGEESSLPADLVIACIGTEPRAFLSSCSRLVKSADSRLLVHDTLQCVNLPNVFALGDCAAVIGQEAELPRTAQVASQQAVVLSRNLRLILQRHRSKLSPESGYQTGLTSFRYFHLGEMIALGQYSASIACGPLHLEGPLAAIGRRLVYATKMPTLTHRIVVLLLSLSCIARSVLSVVSHLLQSFFFLPKRCIK